MYALVHVFSYAVLFLSYTPFFVCYFNVCTFRSMSMFLFLLVFFLFTSFFLILFVFFFKQKTAYEMRISDWSSDVCSSDLVDGQPGPGPGEDPGGLLRRHVMRRHRLHPRCGSPGTPERFRHGDFMDQDVHASRVPDEIPGHAGIAGQHHRAPEMVHAVAEGRFDRRVVDLERRDLQPASIEHYALLDVPGEDHDAFRRCTIVRHPEPDIERVCLLEVGHHVRSAARPDRKSTRLTSSH